MEHERIGTGTGGPGNNGTSGDHPNYNIIEIGYDSRRLEKTCHHSSSEEKPSANGDVKNS